MLSVYNISFPQPHTVEHCHKEVGYNKTLLQQGNFASPSSLYLFGFCFTLIEQETCYNKVIFTVPRSSLYKIPLYYLTPSRFSPNLPLSRISLKGHTKLLLHFRAEYTHKNHRLLQKYTFRRLKGYFFR